MNKIKMVSLVCLAIMMGCAGERANSAYVAPPWVPPPSSTAIIYDQSKWDKIIAEQKANNDFMRVHIDCQEVNDKYRGCDVIEAENKRRIAADYKKHQAQIESDIAEVKKHILVEAELIKDGKVQ